MGKVVRKRQLLFIPFFLLLSLHCFISTALCLDISIDGDQITLNAVDDPLSSILAELTKANIVVRIDPDINPVITASLKNHPLHSGLKSILHPYNFVLTWKVTSVGTQKTFSLAEIQIFEKGGMAKMQYLKPGNNFVVLKNVDTDEKYIKGEVLIHITDKNSLQKLEQLLGKIQGRIIEENVAGGLYRIQVAEDTDIYALVEQINSEIEGVAEPNFVYALNIPGNYQNSAVNDETSKAIKNETSSRGTVAILDSGLTLGQGVEPFIVASLNSFDEGAPLTDALGHGTQMAMLATGLVTPEGGSEIGTKESISIIPVKIFNDQGLTTNFTLIESVNFALENNASILSLSWGTEIKSSFLENSMQQADAAGVIVLAAAGNEPTGTPVYPAAYDTVIGVGALGIDGKPWGKSNFGDFVTLYGPGIAVFPSDDGDSGGTQTYAGTSIATAYIAGELSTFIAENPEASRGEIYTFLGIESDNEKNVK